MPTHKKETDHGRIQTGGQTPSFPPPPPPRALTRILKTGVPEPSLPKSGSPTIQKNIASFIKWESQHQKWEFRTAKQQLVRALPPFSPLKIIKNRGSWHTGPVPFKISKLPSQHSMLGHQRHANEAPFKWCFAGGPMIGRI